MSIDYKELLKKYMLHVDMTEGTDFVQSIFPDDEYSKEEVIALEVISEENLNAQTNR